MSRKKVVMKENPFAEFSVQEIQECQKFIIEEIKINAAFGLDVKSLKKLEGLAEDARFEKLSRELKVQKDGRIA
jgi:hypothetical protein